MKKRTTAKYYPEERPVVRKFEDKGWQFRITEEWDWYAGKSKGFRVEYKSPRMSDWYYQGYALTEKNLLHWERRATANREILRRLGALQTQLTKSLIKQLEMTPDISLTALRRIPSKRLLYATR